MSKILLLILSVLCINGYAQTYTDYYKKPGGDTEQQVAKTNTDFSKLANEITSGHESDYDKIKAIYEWICTHIEYDTQYRIRTADECLKAKKGVCQGYCELFYQLAKAIGIRVEIIEGKSKDQTGYVNPAGHGWLFAYTRENYGILMDPTWGAGSVSGDKFIRDENCWTWFNPTPEWMILSHFPNKDSYQLIDKKLTEKEFLTMSPVNSIWVEYGLNTHKIYERSRALTLALPQFYNQGEGKVEFIDLPMAPSLRIALNYTFRIKMKSDRDFAIINNSIYCKKQEWKDEGNGVFSIEFMPKDTERLTFCIRDDANSGWSTIVKYDIEPPTQNEWDLLEHYSPSSLPEMKAVQNMNTQEWKDAGINEHQMLKLVREQHITELPVLFDGKGQLMNIKSVPMLSKLKTGTEYQFCFLPKGGHRWALVNESDWFTDWQESDGGYLTLTLTPKTAGNLFLYVQTAEGESYWPCLQYVVE